MINKDRIKINRENINNLEKKENIINFVCKILKYEIDNIDFEEDIKDFEIEAFKDFFMILKSDIFDEPDIDLLTKELSNSIKEREISTEEYPSVNKEKNES